MSNIVNVTLVILVSLLNKTWINRLRNHYNIARYILSLNDNK